MPRFSAVAACLLFAACLHAAEAPRKFMVYIGTYSRGTKSEGIYRAEFDPATGKLSAAVLAARVVNPTFLAIHPDGKHLYSVGEIDDFAKGGKKRVGAINAFRIKDDGGLELLGQESSGGGGPCHLVVDRAGKHVLAANYGGGSVCVLPLGKDGNVGKATAFIQHKGSGPDKSRQRGPHAHSINLDSANQFAFAADLGLDKILVYKFDAKAGTLTRNDPPAAKLEAGGGPRHFAFHPSGKLAYACNEMGNTVAAMTYDARAGVLVPFQSISTLPRPTKGNSTAEIVVHPSGKFLYCSNRGHDSIAVFSIDPKTGKLTAAGHQGKGIKTPRNFCLDPSGKWCLVASRGGNDVKVFSVNAKNGMLEPTSEKTGVAHPVCVRFLAWPK